MNTLLEHRLKTSSITSGTYLPTTLGHEFFSNNERIEWITKYGSHCMSFSTMQPDMCFFDVPEIGFIAYQDCLGERVVLSNPICAPEDFAFIIEQFLGMSRKPVSFIQVTPDVAQLLSSKFSMYCTEFGQETLIHLKDWSLKGKKKQIFRTALNQAKKLDITIMETFTHHDDDRISDTWLNTRRCKQKEIRFLIRPKDINHTQGVRRFYGFKDMQPVGFVHFDPIYRNNQVIGYVPNISRANQLFKQGLFYAIMAVALEQFQSEGIERVNLGLSPLSIKNSPQQRIVSSRPLERMFKLTARFGQKYYNFDGIQFTKSRFRGEEQPTYVASHKAIPLKAFAACFKLSKVI